MGYASLFRIIEKCCEVNGELWFVNAILNGLFKVDLATGKVSYIGIVDQKEMYLKNAYSEILYFQDSLYMIPYNASSIGIYNILTDSFEKIVVPEKKNGKFYEAVRIKDKIYLLPYKADKFYCLDMKTKELSKIHGLEDVAVSVVASTLKDEEIWFLEENGQCLYRYQSIKNEIRQIDLEKSKGYFTSIGCVRGKIIITASNMALALSIDPQTEEIASFEFEDYSNVKGKRSYYIAEHQKKIMLVRTGSNDYVMIDVSNMEIITGLFCPNELKIYGKLWKSKWGLVMLPTIIDKTFRFFGGGTIPFESKKAMLDWAENNNFRWKDCNPMPDYGMKTLLQSINWQPGRELEKWERNTNIFRMLKG